MPAPLPRWTNTATHLAVVLFVAGLVGGPVTLMLYARTAWITGQWRALEQPVEFDHRHHVKDDGLDCRYCHYTVETQASAGLPPTSLCMNCHGQVWNSSPQLEPVRASFFSGEPIRWKRVHDLPDFVFFNHSIHVNKGIGCESCHGRVDEMARVYQEKSLQMLWCLDCHRDPTPHLRPREDITKMGYVPEGNGVALREKLAHDYAVRSLVNCSTCHR